MSELSYADLNRTVASLALSRGEMAGYPVPLSGLTLRVEPSHPLAERLNGWTDPDAAGAPDAAQAPAKEDDDWVFVNAWFSQRRRQRVVLARHRKTGEVAWYLEGVGDTVAALIQTLGASVVWPIEAETNAMLSLRRHVGSHKMRQYVLTGSFLETSARSGVTYLFRRLRPTLALRASADQTRVLAALCLHPIAYYDRTFAGAMVPTDDVLAHLLLMRGDEHLFWRRANQHPVHSPLAGLC